VYMSSVSWWPVSLVASPCCSELPPNISAIILPRP
jgi:hypothetical protein